jgi:glycogen operon protein
MTTANWRDRGSRCVTLHLDGADDPDRAADGTLLVDDDFLLLVNGWWEPLDFVVPAARTGQIWRPIVDTYEPTGRANGNAHTTGGHLTVRPRSIVLLRGGRDDRPQEAP